MCNFLLIEACNKRVSTNCTNSYTHALTHIIKWPILMTRSRHIMYRGGTERLRDSKWEKILKDFGECHENSLIESFKMSPHLICLSWGLRSLLWPASGSGLDVIWKLIPQLRHIKWGLILKLSLRPFLSHHLESLRFFFHFMSRCRAVKGAQ